jgi:phage FluMu protein Com
MTFLIAASVILVMAATGGGVYLYRQMRRPKGLKILHFKCPNCRRRLAYKDSQRGHPGKCPQCRTILKFPMVSDEERKTQQLKNK